MFKYNYDISWFQDPADIQTGEGGDMDLIQVDFCHKEEYVAGSASELYKEYPVRNIYLYMGG